MRRGLALIVVVGVLGVLAVLATAFVTMARLERRASQQRVHAARALFLARSGLEDAQARLDANQDPFARESRYGGEDWDDSGGGLSAFEAQQESFRRGAVNREDCPARDAMRPSFFKRGAGGDPFLLTVEGRQRGYSGALCGSQTPLGDTWALKAEDESAKINVNGGFLDAGDRDGDLVQDHRDGDVRPSTAASDTGLGWNFQLKRILGILGAQGEVGLPTLGTDVLEKRPRGGYRSVQQLQQLLGATTDLSPYLTVSSWVDDRVVHPNAYEAQLNWAYASLKQLQERRPALRLEEGGRPPVNLNASPRAVLVALIQDLRGCDWTHFCSSGCQYEIFQPTSGQVADAILSARPFRSWGGFEAFCDGLVPTVVSGLNPNYGKPWSNPRLASGATFNTGGNYSGADLLKANFNPNSRLAKCDPDQTMLRWIDKSDLIVWSTEGNLGPCGTFRIGALGRVADARGKVLAQKSLTAVLERFKLMRQTTQQDFVAGRTLIAPASSYLSQSTATQYNTCGAGASWAAAWGAAPRKGLAVATYPCPMMALPAKAADFDGAIGLASVELPLANPGTGTLRFLHHFDDGWNADGGGATALQSLPGTDDNDLQTVVSESVWPEPPAKLNTLYPDGMHVQEMHTPAFRTAGNLPADATGNHGVLVYWLKPVFGGGKNEADVTIHRALPTIASPLVNTQVLIVGRRRGEWGILVENTINSDVAAWNDNDTGYERLAWRRFDTLGGSPAFLTPGGRWQLVSALFDTDQTSGEAAYSVWSLRGGGAADTSPYAASFLTGFTSDLANVPFNGDSKIALGSRNGYGSWDWGHNAVLDEFAIYDFLDVAATAKTNSDGWCALRYQDGRYYKENDGRFTSATLRPAGGAAVRLRQAWWTEILPGESRMELLTDFVNCPAAAGTPRQLDSTLAAARVKLELLDGSGALLQTLTQWEDVQRTLTAFGYRVTFEPTPNWTATDRLNQPVLESPWFDDITFSYTAGPRFLAWTAP